MLSASVNTLPGNPAPDEKKDMPCLLGETKVTSIPLNEFCSSSLQRVQLDTKTIFYPTGGESWFYALDTEANLVQRIELPIKIESIHTFGKYILILERPSHDRLMLLYDADDYPILQVMTLRESIKSLDLFAVYVISETQFFLQFQSELNATGSWEHKDHLVLFEVRDKTLNHMKIKIDFDSRFWSLELIMRMLEDGRLVVVPMDRKTDLHCLQLWCAKKENPVEWGRVGSPRLTLPVGHEIRSVKLLPGNNCLIVDSGKNFEACLQTISIKNWSPINSVRYESGYEKISFIRSTPISHGYTMKIFNMEMQTVECIPLESRYFSITKKGRLFFYSPYTEDVNVLNVNAPIFAHLSAAIQSFSLDVIDIVSQYASPLKPTLFALEQRLVELFLLSSPKNLPIAKREAAIETKASAHSLGPTSSSLFGARSISAAFAVETDTSERRARLDEVPKHSPF